MIGQTISHYTILEKLGEGGMGIVYKAQDITLDRQVALKFLPPNVSASEQDKARFILEAKATSAMNHPNICTIYSIEEHEGQLFIAMEYVDGRTLQDRKHALSIKQAIDIGIQIADGLAAAHETGIVHRDIKPENIMIRKDGIAQIMDFGIAKLHGVSRLTKEGTTVGTAGYMSPEQLQGHDVDRRSDIFSLGVLLYEMFAGERPFKGLHDAALTYEIINVDPPPLDSMKPEIDPEISRIAMECLQKDPADRFQSAAEVAKELRRVRRASDILNPHHRGGSGQEKRSRSLPGSGPSVPAAARNSVPSIIIGCGAVAIGAVLLLWRPWETTPLFSQPVERFAIPFPKNSLLPLLADGLAISPDGRHLALIIRGDSGSQLYMRDMDQFEMHPVAATAGLDISGPFFSPDCQWIGFFANGKLMKLSLGGGTPVTICESLPGQASWGEAGSIVFLQEWGSPLWIVSSEAGSAPRPLTKLNTKAGERAHLHPCVLPGGRNALFSIWRGGTLEDMLVAVVDLSTGEHRTVLNGGSGAFYLRTGDVVFVRGSTLMAALFDLNAMKLTGEPRPMLEHLLVNGNNGHPFFSLSGNGTLVYAEGSIEFAPTAISIVDHGGKIRRIESREANLLFPHFSPDGSRLAVDITGATFQIGVYDLRRNILTPLTFAADNIGPGWSPDGSRLTFLSNMDGRYKIYTIAADGSGTPQELVDPGGIPEPPRAFTWTPDGKAMAYVAFNKETGSDIWVYAPADTSSARPFIATQANESNPVLSPDGDWIAYESDESGENEVYVQPFPIPGGRWRISTGKGTAPVWSPDGHHIYYIRNDQVVSVEVTPKNGGGGQSLLVGEARIFLIRPGLTSFDISKDGKTYVIGQMSTKGSTDHVNVVVNWAEELKEKLGSQQTTTVR